jgi:hypothetical protein
MPTLDSSTRTQGDSWELADGPQTLRRSISTKVVAPEPDTDCIRCVSEVGHSYHDSEHNRDYNFA